MHDSTDLGLCSNLHLEVALTAALLSSFGTYGGISAISMLGPADLRAGLESKNRALSPSFVVSSHAKGSMTYDPSIPTSNKASGSACDESSKLRGSGYSNLSSLPV